MAAVDAVAKLDNAATKRRLLWELSFATEALGDRKEAAAEVRRFGELARALGSDEAQEQATRRLHDLDIEQPP